MALFGKLFRQLQANMQIVGGFGLAIVVGASLVPQTLGVSYYRSMLTNYKDGQPVPIDGDLKELINKVLVRVNLRPEQEVKLDFITSFPSDPVHKGSVEMRTGAFIGLPATFACRSIDELDRSSLVVEQRYVDWTSDAGKSLLNSLILSDKAKAFVIAREIKYTSTFGVQIDAILRTGFCFFAYWTGHMFNRKMYLTQSLKFWARFGIFSAIGAGWLLMYVAIDDAYSCWQDNRADRFAARLMRVYAEGGVEYYDSILRRNQALRTLLRSVGESRFTKFGNEVTTVRVRHAQLTSRKDNLIKYLKEYDSDANAENSKAGNITNELSETEKSE